MVKAEKARLDAKPGTRSSEKTLLAFTDCDVALDLDGDGRSPPPRPEHFITKVTRWIARRHRGDRAAAERDAIDLLTKAIGVKPGGADVRRVALEWAPVAAACGVDDDETWQLIARALRAKPRDVDAYQRVLLRLVPRVAQAGR
jgi:hypothetical protein